MLDPWIIEEINRREREKQDQDQGEGVPLHVPAVDPREMPEKPADRQPDPGYEMPNPGAPKSDEPPKVEKSDRGVTVIDIGGDVEEGPNVIDITKLPDIPPDDPSDERPE